MSDTSKPIKRSPQLAPLSREHHEGLLFVWKIRQGLRNATPVSEIHSFVEWFWINVLQAHLIKEEEVLIKDLPDGDLMVQRMLKEHADIRAKMNASHQEINEESLSALALQLEKHIRFEERELFPYIEQLLSSTLLEKIAVCLNEKKACASPWSNEFWLQKH